MQTGSLVEYVGHPRISEDSNLIVLSRHGYTLPQKNYPYLVIDGPIEVQFNDAIKPAIIIEGFEKVVFWVEAFKELQPPITIDVEELIIDELICY